MHMMPSPAWCWLSNAFPDETQPLFVSWLLAFSSSTSAFQRDLTEGRGKKGNFSSEPVSNFIFK